MPADLTEQVSEATLRSLLTCKDKPQATEGDPALARCLKIAAHVFNAWTGCGARPAGLADRFLDGSIDVLESFVRSSPQPSEQKYATSSHMQPTHAGHVTHAGADLDDPLTAFTSTDSHRTSPSAACTAAQNIGSGSLETPDRCNVTPSASTSYASSSIPPAADMRSAGNGGGKTTCSLAGDASHSQGSEHTTAEQARPTTGPYHSDRLDSPDALLRTSPGSTRREVRDSRPAGLPQLEVRQAAELSYDAFVHEYMAPNRPVLIQSAANDWKAMRDWVTADGGVDIDFFEAQFGSAHVWVTDTGRQHSGCGSRRDMTVAEFAQYWRRFQAGQERDILYLKDWHFANEFPGYKAYQLPHYFREDWLNEYYDMRQSAARTAPAAPAHGAPRPPAAHTRLQNGGCSSPLHAVEASECACEPCGPPSGVDSHHSNDSDPAECGDGATEAAGEPSRRQADIVTSDYRFVYLGPKGTWTPLHADVLRSYSWSTNVCGRKRWLLLPPQHTHLLYDRFGREMAPDFGLGPETACADVLQQFPNLERAAQLVIECIQEPGDTIFVPSGWHHTVENLADTLSINHNWLNGYNIHWGWELLQREYQEAAEAIEDCRPMCEPAEFEGLVQRNLAANCGLDYRSMADFVGAIAQRELAAIRRPGGPLPQLLAHAFNLQRAGFVLKGLAEAMARSQCASGQSPRSRLPNSAQSGTPPRLQDPFSGSAYMDQPEGDDSAACRATSNGCEHGSRGSSPDHMEALTLGDTPAAGTATMPGGSCKTKAQEAVHMCSAVAALQCPPDADRNGHAEHGSLLKVQRLVADIHAELSALATSTGGAIEFGWIPGGSSDDSRRAMQLVQ